MKKKALLLSIVLLLLVSLIPSGLSEEFKTEQALEEQVVEQAAEFEQAADAEQAMEPIVIGEGELSFLFQMKDWEGTEMLYEVHTDCETVGQALLELELIQGDEGPYGLYIKLVCGLEHDYSKDGHYWAFYVDGEYAMTGVDSTPIAEGASYALIAE